MLPRTPGRASRDPNFVNPRNVSATAAAKSACDDKTHAESPGSWPENRYAWRWNAKTFGENNSTLTALKKAHDAMGQDRDRLLGPARTPPTSPPPTTATTTRQAGAHDGVNVVDKADLSSGPCGPTAIACTSVWWNADERLSPDRHPFRDRREMVQQGLHGTYDYQGIGAHQFGHSIGLSTSTAATN